MGLHQLAVDAVLFGGTTMLLLLTEELLMEMELREVVDLVVAQLLKLTTYQ